MPNAAAADAQALGSFGKVRVGMLVHIFGQRLHINLGSRLVAAGAWLKALSPTKQRSDRYVEQITGLLERQALLLFVRKHLFPEA